MSQRYLYNFLFTSFQILILSLSGCTSEASIPSAGGCESLEFVYLNQTGCDGQVYPEPSTSPYVLPFEAGKSYMTGLTNCSSSYHAAGQPDQYAFDFNMDIGEIFRAARGGEVIAVEESQPSNGRGAGNSVIVDHQDGTYGVYLHSPKDGILVEVGEYVVQGQILGEAGRSGLAGYPHLHFIVIEGQPEWPWRGVPVSFRNVDPPDVVLKSQTLYSACGG